MSAFESGRRLCLLFEAGQTRYAIEATSVVEVSPPDEDAGDKIRGVLSLVDLSRLLGDADEERPGLAVVLDVSPTLALRVRRVVEVADVARDPFFMLPPGLGAAFPVLTRGAVLHAGKLYLELSSDALPHEAGAVLAAPMRPIYVVDAPPERALIFESQGRLYGVPLQLVSQVISAGDGFCPMPAPSGPVSGLYPHAQVLWPIYSVAGLLGGQATREDLFVLTELAGQNVGLCASRVLGVHQGFTAADAGGEYVAKGLSTPALFLDFQRMFS